ncbi:MAG: flagellar M-ring protein FliF [Chthoniobacter sp.]|nr:flagellar M-ring protein FliF [Chthoniobacter sp.]
MKTFLTQFVQLWRQLGLNQRVSIIVALVGVVGGLTALVVWSHRPHMALLYGRLGEKDVAEVLTAIQAAGVTYELGSGGTSVYVPSDSVHKLRIQLATKGVPAGEGVGFEVFDRANFGISDFVQRTNFVRALQGELSRTISQLQGVRSARVLIVQPENRLLFSDVKAKPTASVFIEGSVSVESVNAIRFLVANAVESLRADDVAVVDNRGNVLTEGLNEDPQLGSASSQIKLRKGVEDYFSKKVESMLAKVLGPGTAVVRVSAELEVESTTRSEEKYDPDGQVLRSEVSTDESTQTNEVDGAKGGATGTTANTPSPPGNEPGGKATGKNSEQVQKGKTLNYEINKITLNAIRAPGTVARMTAAVFVAAKAQPRTPAELEALRKMVVNALGIKAADEKEAAKIVSLEEVAFDGSPTQKAGVMEFVKSNPDLLKQVFAVLVAVALVFVFVRMLKRTKPDEIPIEILEQTYAATTGEGGHAGGPISVEKLNEMIRRKPENIGAALRGWMATGGKN